MVILSEISQKVKSKHGVSHVSYTTGQLVQIGHWLGAFLSYPHDAHHTTNLRLSYPHDVHHNPKCPFCTGYCSVNVSGACYTSSIKKVEKGSQTRKEFK